MNMDDDLGRTISFKKNVSIEDMSKAMKNFGRAFKLLSKREATYTDFTNWLAVTDFVDVSPSLKEINDMVEKGVTKNGRS